MIEWFLMLPWYGQLATVLVCLISIPILVQLVIFLFCIAMFIIGLILKLME